MADNNTPTGGAPAAPVTPAPMTPLPNVTERLTVPASALGLETDLPEHLKIPAQPEVDLFPKGPTGPAATPPAAPTTPPAPATGPTGPATTPPATPPAATGPTGPAATPPPAPEQKVKIGDKEYTTKELEKILADTAKNNQQPTPPPPTPPQPQQKVPTKEEIQAAEATWQQNFIKDEAIAYPATEADIETLLGGGKEAVEFFTKKLTEVTARAVLLARKSVYADMNPQMEAFAKRIEPLFNNHQQVERVGMEQAFLHAYPEYASHIETAREVAEALVARYPEHCQKMNTQQFIATVNEQTDKIIQAEYKKWNPNATDTWRDAAKKTAAAPAPTTTAPTTPAPTTPAPTTPAPAAPANPWNTPPAANSPASTPAAGAPDWNKSVAKSLQD